MFDEIIRISAESYGLVLPDDVFTRFSTFNTRLVETNEKFNLTRIEGDENTAHFHFIDSLSPLMFGLLPVGARCIDVGAGAGFPSMPLAIARNDLKITMLDSVGKKAAFLADQNDIAKNTAAIHGRAEDFARKQAFREGFDFAFARAVAPLNVLLELTMPFVRTGGALIAWKGPGADEEIIAAKKAIEALGGDSKITLHQYKLMNGIYDRRLIIINKNRQISSNYPRNPGIIRNKPIGS